jgi:hypothetical protein
VLALARVVYARDLTVLKLAVPSFRADFRPSSFQLLRLSCAGSDRDMFEQHLVQTLIKYLGEATLAFVTVTLHDMGGPDVCQVTVELAGHPVYLQDNTESTLYVRAGNSTGPLPVHEAVRYVSTRWP